VPNWCQVGTVSVPVSVPVSVSSSPHPADRRCLNGSPAMPHRYFQDDLLTSPSVSSLRASGVVDGNTTSVIIAFGEGDEALRREIGVTHRQFPNGGGWSFFVCPRCSRRARVLKIYDGLPMCWRCCAANGVCYRSAGGSPVEREAAWMARLQKLRELLDGGAVRLRPRPGRALDRRRELTVSLRRSLIRQRQDLLPKQLDGLKLQ
jgi:hypothetical protein